MAGNEFSFDVSEWVQKCHKNLDLFMREFNQDIAEQVQENTPYLTGFLRGSWTAAIGTPDLNFQGSKSSNISAISLILQNAKGEDTVYHTNNASYGPYVEFGTSKMAPRAFVRRTIAQARGIAEKVAARIARL